MNRVTIGLAVWLLTICPAWGQTVAIVGDHFTVQRGTGPQAKFLLFVSYFDAMRATSLDEDLDYIANTLKFDGIRIFPNWWVYSTAGPCTMGSDTLLDGNGNVRGDGTPVSGPLQRLIQIIEAAKVRGLIVDVTFTRETVSGLTVAEYRTGVTRVATLLRDHRNVVFDLQNEANNTANPNQTLTTNQIKNLRNDVLANIDPSKGDPARILATSTGGNPSDAVTLAQTASLPFIAFHDARGPGWETRVPGVVATLRTGNRPVHLQEPEAWNAGLTLCGQAETGDSDPAHFRTAMQNAKQAGAAAWTFHNRLGFMLGTGSSFKARVQAIPALKDLLEGNPGTGVQALADVAVATQWPVTVTLTVDLVGSGAGTVSTTSGLVCSGTGVTCSASVAPGTAVTFTAAASSGTFRGWSGACSGTTACTITASADAMVSATFSPPPVIAPQYYHLDAIGSVRAVTGPTGAVLRRHDYFPFGEEYLAQEGNDAVRFSGKERDAETGLDYFKARYFSARGGRLTSPDPLLQPAAIIDPQRFNRYVYVRNNPLILVDPTGGAIELVGDAGQRQQALDALCSAVGPAACGYLYEKRESDGRYYVGIYSGGPTGTGTPFEKINQVTALLGAMISDTRVVELHVLPAGSKVTAPDGSSLTIGTLDYIGRQPGASVVSRGQVSILDSRIPHMGHWMASSCQMAGVLR